MERIATAEAPRPAGHYSQGVVHGGVIYVAGQLPIDPHAPPTASHEIGSIEAQTERTLRNVQAILRAAGSDLDQLLQLTIYVSDMASWGKVNETIARVLGPHRPARAVVPVGVLHYGFGIEMQAIAAVPPKSGDTDGRRAP